jgi:hypothetical protein
LSETHLRRPTTIDAMAYATPEREPQPANVVRLADAAAPSGADSKTSSSLCPPSQAPREWLYRNLTPWRIEYKARPEDKEPALTIPPLGEVRVRHVDCAEWNTSALRQRGQLEVVPAPHDLVERLPTIILLLGWCGIVLTSLVWAILGGISALPVRAVAAAMVLVPALALVAAVLREVVQSRHYNEHIAAYRNRADGFESGRSTQGLNTDHHEGRHDGLVAQVTRGLAQALILFASLAIAVGGPALAIYYSSQLHEVLPIDVGALFRLENPMADVDEAVLDSPAVWQLLIGHTAQWVLVSVAALVPAAMYFQFDRERLAAVQGRWVRQVFRLDPTVRSLGDIEAKYGAQIEASFGTLGRQSRMRQRRARRSPVVVATILITVGWVVLATGATIPKLEPDGAGGYVWPDDTFPVADFFQPQGTALGFAFLGAYLFALFHIIRAYQRRDLVPKTYNTIVVRVLAAYVLTLAGEALLPGQTLDSRVLIGFAFFAGFLPQSALMRLRELVTVGADDRRLRLLEERAPLTELEGIDLYDRTRLAEEGVNNVHALAHSDIVELMSATRIPADRLVDWTDQAILYLRVGGDRLGDDDGQQDVGDKAAKTKRSRPRARDNMEHLRRFGIRNASDLLQAYEAAVERGRSTARAGGIADTDTVGIDKCIRTEVDQLRTALSRDAMQPDESGYLPIQGMLDTLPDEEWFTQIRNWRSSEFGRCDSWALYLDGRSPYSRMSGRVPPRVCALLKRPPMCSMVAADDPGTDNAEKGPISTS